MGKLADTSTMHDTRHFLCTLLENVAALFFTLIAVCFSRGYVFLTVGNMKRADLEHRIIN